MSVIELPKKLHPDFAVPGIKPAGAVEIDWSNPLTRGLVAFIPIIESGVDRIYDYVNRRHIALNSGMGGVQQIDFSSDNFTLSIPNLGSDTTVMYIAEPSAPTTGEYLSDGSSGNEFAIIQGYQANHYNIFGGSYPEFNNADNSKLPMSGGIDAVTYSVTGSNVFGAVNGNVLIDVPITSGDFTPTSPIKIGSTNGGTNYYSGSLRYIAFWNRGQSKAEIASLHADPYALLKPSVPMFWFTSAAGGTGTTVSASLGTIDATTYAATVNAAKAITATLGTIDVSTYAATVSLGVSVSATLGTIDASTYAATVSTATAITATLANADVSTYAANISLGSATSISATLGTIDVSTYAATVTAPLVIAATVGGVRVATFKATIQSAATATNSGGLGNYDFLNPPSRKQVKVAKTVQRIAKKQVEREAEKGKPAPKSYQIAELKRALKKQQIEFEDDYKQQLETARDKAIDDAIQQEMILQDLITNEKQHQILTEQAEMQIMLMMLSAL